MNPQAYQQQQSLSAPFSVTPFDRIIVLSGGVTNQSVGAIVRQIECINMYDTIQHGNNPTYDREKFPIYIVINSGGGSIYDGFALVATIQGSKTPVVTQAQGHCMSMALLVFAAGHYRTADKRTTFMYHQGRGVIGGSFAEMETSVEEQQRIMALYDSELANMTKLDQMYLDILKDKNLNHYFTAEKALEYGIADKITPKKGQEEKDVKES